MRPWPPCGPRTRPGTRSRRAACSIAVATGIARPASSPPTRRSPVGGELEHHPADQRRRHAVEGDPAHVDVVVGLLARGQRARRPCTTALTRICPTSASRRSSGTWVRARSRRRGSCAVTAGHRDSVDGHGRPARATRLQAASPPTIFTEMSALAVRTGSVNLGQGFPDQDGPPEVIAAAVAALRGGANQYAPGPGVPELRAGDRAATSSGTTASSSTRTRRSSSPPDATEAIAAALLGAGRPGRRGGGARALLRLLRRDDPDGRRRTASGRPCGAPRLPARRRRAAGGGDADRTRFVLLNTPHNPTGTVLDRTSSQAVADVADRARPGRHHRRGLRAPDLRRRRARAARDAARDVRADPDAVQRRQVVLVHRLEGRLGDRPGRAGRRGARRQAVAHLHLRRRRSSRPSRYALDHEPDFPRELAARPPGAPRPAAAPGSPSRARRRTSRRAPTSPPATVRDLGWADGLAFCLALPERAGVVAIPTQVVLRRPGDRRRPPPGALGVLQDPRGDRGRRRRGWPRPTSPPERPRSRPASGPGPASDSGRSSNATVAAHAASGTSSTTRAPTTTEQAAARRPAPAETARAPVAAQRTRRHAGTPSTSGGARPRHDHAARRRRRCSRSIGVGRRPGRPASGFWRCAALAAGRRVRPASRPRIRRQQPEDRGRRTARSARRPASTDAGRCRGPADGARSAGAAYGVGCSGGAVGGGQVEQRVLAGRRGRPAGQRRRRRRAAPRRTAVEPVPRGLEPQHHDGGGDHRRSAGPGHRASSAG